MKKVIFSLALLLFLVKTFGQTTDTTFSSEYYLQKSRDQKSGGALMLLAGTAMSSIALIMGLHQLSDAVFNTFSDTPPKKAGAATEVLFYTGIGLSLGSLPLFIASKRNSRVAATISLHNQKTLYPQQNSVALKNQPALTLRVPL
ncbi:MAG: hypothetical protein JWQ40_3582 [Segetibacter sp.]|nr:hypothetical protein [Segetibacter sp.]